MNPSFLFNPNYIRRDELLDIESRFWDDEENDDDIVEVEIPLEALELLFAEKFIDPHSRQNYSPSAHEFLQFMRKYPNVVAHGYAVSPYRDDYRISIEGLMVEPEDVTPALRADFELLCQNADVLDLQGELYSWWD